MSTKVRWLLLVSHLAIAIHAYSNHALLAMALAMMGYWAIWTRLHKKKTSTIDRLFLGAGLPLLYVVIYSFAVGTFGEM